MSRILRYGRQRLSELALNQSAGIKKDVSVNGENYVLCFQLPTKRHAGPLGCVDHRRTHTKLIAAILVQWTTAEVYPERHDQIDSY